jgi:glycerol-3-phosphate dehydrogenase (NAD(P)+)
MRADSGHQAAVLGAGSWGTALAIHLASVGHGVTLWGRDAGLIAEMQGRRANPTYLPDITFPPLLRPVASLDEALAGARHVIVAIPSHGLRAVVREAANEIPAGTVLVSATKGIEAGSLQRMSEIIQNETGHRHAVVALSGPSFAAEVARHLPTALVAASTDEEAVKAVQDQFRGPAFRLYGSEDVVGVEIGAALKNIIAIAAGVTESMSLGHNAMSALITRGLAEISRLACAMGGRRESLSGLSGLGDLVLTCTGALSRNRHVGIELGRGRSLEEILAGMRMVAEGVRTTSAALALGEKYGVELPIAGQMAEVLAGRSTPAAAVGNLMLRPQRVEHDAVGH